MPIIASAKKKLRQDKKRRVINLLQQQKVTKAIHAFKRSPTSSHLSVLYSVLDMTAKKHIYHPKKVARLKKRLSRLLKKKSP